MSSSGRADGRTGTPRDVFPMPRDSSYLFASDNGKDKHKERGAFTRKLSGSISLDGGALANKRRPTHGGGSELASYSGIRKILSGKLHAGYARRVSTPQ